MKKFILLAIACTFVACAPTEKVITGQVDGDGSIIIFSVTKDIVLDTVEIVDGKFRYVDTLGDNDIYAVAYGKNVAIVVLELGEVNIDFKSDNTAIVSGTKMNDSMQAYVDFNQKIKNTYYQTIDSLNKLYAEDTEKLTSVITKYADKANNNIKEYYNSALETNKKNILGAYLFLEGIMDKNINEINRFVEQNPITSNFSRLDAIKESKMNFENTDKGKMFVDFTARNIENTEDVKLSDYVGKGNYVILDFWASWCPPCKAEMPNLLSIHDKYSEKGLVLLSIDVWDKHPNAVKAIKDWGMTWEQIYASDNKVATELYGILGIPTLILIDKDGTIISRELRGEALAEKIAELYK